MPRITVGQNRWFTRSSSFASVQGAFSSSGETSPPTEALKANAPTNRYTSPSMKSGILRPRNPTVVSAISPQEYWWVAE